MELTDRKKQILKIVVESYINTAEPVGSKAIVEQMPGKISSATIRNELADLVEMGYLEQPHTSAGRVPSAKGYRLYVNELMERKALSPEETAKINDALSGQMKQVDQVISQAGQMVSSFVGYPTYAVADHRTVATVQRFELISVSESSFIAVVMLSDNRVKSQLMQLDLPVDAETLPQLSHLLNTHFVGAAPEQMNATLMSLSDQVSGQWFLLLNRVTEYACTLLEETQHQQVFTNGASQLLKFPEFRDIDKAHDLMSFMVDNKEEPAGAPERCAHADPYRAGKRQRRPEGEQRGHRQLRHRGQHAGSGGRCGPHPHGLRRCGGAAELLCREPEPYVW